MSEPEKEANEGGREGRGQYEPPADEVGWTRDLAMGLSGTWGRAEGRCRGCQRRAALQEMLRWRLRTFVDVSSDARPNFSVLPAGPASAPARLLSIQVA